MSVQAQISPNVPDVMPDYLDVRTGDAEPGHREGECVPNIPDVPPEVVSEDNVAVPPATEADPASASASDSPASAPKARWIGWHTAATVFVVAAFGALLCSQAISSLALAATLPQWAQYLLLVPLGVCCLALLGVGVSLVRSWLRLRAMTQIDLDALEELRSRAQTREDGTKRFQAAKNALRSYLVAYPIEGADCRLLQSAGIGTGQMAVIAKERAALLAAVGDSRSWLEDFRDRFQTGIDQAAKARVKSWSLKAAGCVMASPLPFLDAVLVLGISLKMIRDLSVIYNIRCSRAGILILMQKAIVAAFIAGVAEDALETAGGMASEELSGMLGESAVAGLGVGMARVVAPKLGEGAINAFFILRLGKAAIRMLQPLKPK